jgi:hypothetical protein
MSKADLTAKLQANGYDIGKLAPEVTPQEVASNEGMPSTRRFDFATATPEEKRQIVRQSIAGGNPVVNVGAGALRGAGSIGATLMRPLESAEENEQRRLAMTSALEDLGAKPESFGFQSGKLGGEIAGTGGLGRLAANALTRVPGVVAAVPNFVNALRTGGFGAGKIAPSVAAGAVVGGGTSGLINPDEAGLGTAIGGGLPLVGKGVPALAGAVTPNVVKEAFAAGKKNATAFIDNLRKNVPTDDVLETLKGGISQMRDDASTAYVTSKTGWAADRTPLDYAKVDAAINKIDSSITYSGKSMIGADEQRIVSEAKNAIQQWKSAHPVPTAVDLDALKRRLDSIYPESSKQTQAKRALSEFVSSVKQTITDNVPGYKDAMKAYETQTKLVREISDALGGGDRIKKETALNKIMQALKETPSGDYKQALLGQIEAQTGQQLKPAIAGQLLSPRLPQSLSGRGALGLGGFASITTPGVLAALPLTSPRLVGEAAYGAGRAASVLPRISQQFPGGANALAGLFRTSTPTQQLMVNSLSQNQ